MRQTILATLIATALAGNLRDRSYYEAKFYNWLQEHKVEIRSGEHFVHMLANFAANDDLIHSHNAGNATYTLGHNKFSHMNVNEWRSFVRRGFVGQPENTVYDNEFTAGDVSALPSSVDWVAKGAVTDVKDQGQCGSCWSFSTTGSLEGAYYNKYGTLKAFSEQAVVDCDTVINDGCDGGIYDFAFKWIKRNGGIPVEADYPYVSGTTKVAGTCDKAALAKKDPKSAVTGYTNVKKNSDADFIAAVAQQPVSVAIQAGTASFQLYKSGVLTGTCGADLDHAVLAVGYGTDNGLDYYKIKNSWGPTWGEGGYIRLVRDASLNKGAGQCGVLSGPPTFPTL